jgi:hypothetical protein
VQSSLSVPDIGGMAFCSHPSTQPEFMLEVQVHEASVLNVHLFDLAGKRRFPSDSVEVSVNFVHQARVERRPA